MTNGNGGGTRGSALAVALQLLGATAGVSALAAFVGAATLWLRFDTLHLPADQAVAQVPERLLLIVGVHATAAAVALGALAALALALFPQERGKPTRRFWIALVVVVLAGIGFTMVFGNVGNVALLLVVGLIAALGVAAIILGAKATNLGRRHVALIVFAVFSVCGAALAIVRTIDNPLLEPAAVLLKDGKPGMAGFYVGQTDDRLYLAPLPGDGTPGDPFADAPIESVVEIPRSEILRVATRRPTSLRNNGGGRDQAQTLLADLQAQQLTKRQRLAEIAIRTPQPVKDFAPLAHLHSQETIWPMSAEKYIRSSVLLWVHNHRCVWSVATRKHLKPKEEKLLASKGKIDPRRLGPGPGSYAHTPSGGKCADPPGPSVDAAQITRPFETTNRPKSVPVTEGFYLNVDNDVRNGERRTNKEGSQQFLRKTPVYYERHPEPHPVSGQPARTRITYWFFYGLSQPPGPNGILKHFVHEGDWERISVLLEPKAQGAWAPISVRYFFHEENRDVPWYAVRRVAAGEGGTPTHPVVYVARRSHASYPRAGQSEEERPLVGDKRVTASDEAIACPNCPQWRTWEALDSAVAAPWYGFGGAWGNAGGQGGTTGPLGPSELKSCGKDGCPRAP